MPPPIEPLPIRHFLVGCGVGLAFITALFNTVIGVVGIYAIKESLPKWGRPLVICLTVVGVALPLTSAWQQASQDQQSDLAQRLAEQTAQKVTDELTSVKGSLNSLSAHDTDVSGALSKIASAANVSSQKSVAQIVSAIISKLPRPPPGARVGIRIISLQPKPLLTGAAPAVTVALMNGGPPKYMALTYVVQPYSNVNGCFDTYRGECEQNWWLSFLAEHIRKNYLEVPAGQSVSTTVTVPAVVVHAGENPTNTRYYFFVRAYDRKGKKLFDACFYQEPNPTPNTPSSAIYCVAHND